MTPEILKTNRLLRECVEALKTTLPDERRQNQIRMAFQQMYPLTPAGKINWDRIDRKIDIGYDVNNIIPVLEELIHGSFEAAAYLKELWEGPLDTYIYIKWSDDKLPMLETDLDAVITSFDDVTCVSAETFIFNSYQRYIIEVLPDNKMTAGLVI
jgi:hypothetical protein